MGLPQPGDGFEWRVAPAGPVLVCRPLEDVARHVFTTRPWPLGSRPGSADAESWNDIARVMDVESDRLLRVHQVHGAGVVVQRSGAPVAGNADADIVLGDDPAVALAVQTADCVPLLIADSRTGAVAAAHAGWRGHGFSPLETCHPGAPGIEGCGHLRIRRRIPDRSLRSRRE